MVALEGSGAQKRRYCESQAGQEIQTAKSRHQGGLEAMSLDKHHARAEEWVRNWVDFNVKSRVLDGRPDRVFIKTLTQDLADLLRSLDTPPAPKKKVNADGR